MIIETKYSLDDDVWLMINDKVISSKIREINFNSVDNQTKYLLYVCENEYFDETLFSSKDELLKSL